MMDTAVKMVKSSRVPSGKRRLISRLRGVATGVGLVVTALCFTPQSAMADTPSVTDFGNQQKATVQYTWTENVPSAHYAMFLTLYEDGRHQVDVRPIQSDEVVSFRTDHPNWELCPELMWFVNMPVYIKEIPHNMEADAI